MSLLLFWRQLTANIPSRDLGFKPKGWINLLISRGYANANPAVLIDDGTLMEDTVALMESLTALMGGATNEGAFPKGMFEPVSVKSYILDTLPMGVISSNKPKGGIQ